ncbi:MAG TPA: hypothetical protein DCR97_09025 [Deltaproteobacteria bacterium]|nr:hypothetical protein [Deltaproteobacteria bacterium]
MKTATFCSLIVAGFLLLPSFALSASYGDIYVGLIDGDVLMHTEDTQDWVPAAPNTPLGESDRLWVAGGGRSELRLRHGAVIRLNSHTAFEVGTVDGSGFRFFVDAGQVYVRIEDLRNDAIVIETPAATILSDRRSSFRVDVNETGEVSLSVVNGVVMVDRPYDNLEVASGQRLVFKPGWLRPQFAALQSLDAFDRWNRQRDRKQFEGGPHLSRRYLPEELWGYAGDLDRNGRWVETSDYGFVWMPTVVTGERWSPYGSGRWVWMRGDYIWISYDHWGWAPHHYGRWAFVRPFGWCWVPPVRTQAYWGPGYVGWVETPAAISWVPLAPREIYYGRGFHGPQSVDVRRLPRQTPINENVSLYRNVLVAYAVTTVHRDTFLTGKPAAFKGQTNPFLERRTVSPPPTIKPEKATTIPLIREVKDSERPPTHLFTGKAKGKPNTPLTPSLPARTGPDKPAYHVAPPSMPVRPMDRDNHIPNSDIGVPDVKVPLPPPPPQPHVTVPKIVPPMTGGQPIKEGARVPARPVTGDAKAKRPVHDVSKPPLPPQASQPSDGPKKPLSSSTVRGDGRTTNGKPVGKEAAPAAILKPPAPNASAKGDREKGKHGDTGAEGKDHREDIRNGTIPDKEDLPGKESRQERGTVAF